MARGINKVILVGNLGGDPDVRYSQSGAAVTKFSVATSEGWKDKQSDQWQERTEWHNVVCFNKLGEIAGQYLKKGSKVYIEGSLRTNSWEQDGQKRYKTEVIGREMQMLDSRSDQAGGASRSTQDMDQSPAQSTQDMDQSPSQPPQNVNQSPPEAALDTASGAEDDIPF